MIRKFENERHWRMRAEEARAIADDCEDAYSRECMLSIARQYDELAERASQAASAKRPSGVAETMD